MKIKRPPKKKIIIGLITLAVIIAGMGAFYFWQARQAADSSHDASNSPGINIVDLDPPTQEQIDAGKSQEKEASKEKTSSSSATPIDITITAANQTDDLLQIRTLIDALAPTGSCALQLVKGDDSVQKTANTQNLANSSTCQGFDIAISELSPGTWKLSIAITMGERKGIATRDVLVN